MCCDAAKANMNVQLSMNTVLHELDAGAHDTLLAILRRNGFFGVKHGCEDGTCGACHVLVDGVPVNSCVTLAAQVGGQKITTIEGVGGEQQRGYKGSQPLDPLQTAFVEAGAIQ